MTPSRTSREGETMHILLANYEKKCITRKRLGGAIYAGPEVHSAQLFTAAGLEVAEGLDPVCGVTAEHQAHQQRPAGGFSAEHVDFTAEIGLSPSAQEAGVFVGLFLDGGDGLVKVHRFRRGIRGAPGGAQGGSVEGSTLDYGNLGGAHDGHVLQQLQGAALLGGWPVIKF